VVIDPATTALLVFDVIEHICARQPKCREQLVPAVASLLERARQAGVAIAYGTRAANMSTWLPEVAPAPGDIKIENHAQDRFYNTDLDKAVKGLGGRRVDYRKFVINSGASRIQEPYLESKKKRRNKRLEAGLNRRASAARLTDAELRELAREVCTRRGSDPNGRLIAGRSNWESKLERIARRARRARKSAGDTTKIIHRRRPWSGNSTAFRARLARGERLLGWACKTRTGESVRELSDWNSVTTSPEVGASPAGGDPSRASCVIGICSSGQEASPLFGSGSSPTPTAKQHSNVRRQDCAARSGPPGTTPRRAARRLPTSCSRREGPCGRGRARPRAPRRAA
jgi:hypothetical protein